MDTDLARIEGKLDATLATVNDIRVHIGRLEERVDNHIRDDDHEQAVLHTRINSIHNSQRWWLGKLFGAVVAGGGLMEAIHRFFGGDK